MASVGPEMITSALYTVEVAKILRYRDHLFQAGLCYPDTGSNEVVAAPLRVVDLDHHIESQPGEMDLRDCTKSQPLRHAITCYSRQSCQKLTAYKNNEEHSVLRSSGTRRPRVEAYMGSKDCRGVEVYDATSLP